jgi:hypothetical protein
MAAERAIQQFAEPVTRPVGETIVKNILPSTPPPLRALGVPQIPIPGRETAERVGGDISAEVLNPANIVAIPFIEAEVVAVLGAAGRRVLATPAAQRVVARVAAEFAQTGDRAVIDAGVREIVGPRAGERPLAQLAETERGLAQPPARAPEGGAGVRAEVAEVDAVARQIDEKFRNRDRWRFARDYVRFRQGFGTDPTPSSRLAKGTVTRTKREVNEILAQQAPARAVEPAPAAPQGEVVPAKPIITKAGGKEYTPQELQKFIDNASKKGRTGEADRFRRELARQQGQPTPVGGGAPLNRASLAARQGNDSLREGVFGLFSEPEYKVFDRIGLKVNKLSDDQDDRIIELMEGMFGDNTARGKLGGFRPEEREAVQAIYQAFDDATQRLLAADPDFSLIALEDYFAGPAHWWRQAAHPQSGLQEAA